MRSKWKQIFKIYWSQTHKLLLKVAFPIWSFLLIPFSWRGKIWHVDASNSWEFLSGFPCLPFTKVINLCHGQHGKTQEKNMGQCYHTMNCADNMPFKWACCYSRQQYFLDCCELETPQIQKLKLSWAQIKFTRSQIYPSNNKVSKASVICWKRSLFNSHQSLPSSQ